MSVSTRAAKQARIYEFTSITYPPPDLVFTDDMEVINTWPEAWYKSVPLMQDYCLLPGVWKKQRSVLVDPPKVNKMASHWYDYPGHAQGTQGWHNQRFDYIISGSRVGTILGNNPYQDEVLLYNQLRGALPNDPVNHHMIRGTKFEPVAMDYLSKIKGWVLFDMPLIHHKDRKNYPILVVSLDRLFGARYDGKWRKKRIIVECKCPWEIKKSNLDLYNDQMQLQMECVTSYDPDPDRRNKCICYLFQYRDASWSDSGTHEYSMDLVRRDPSWLTRNWPQLLDFDQRVRRDRLRNDITLEVYNNLGAISNRVFKETKEHLMKQGSMEERQIDEVAKEAMVRAHQEAYNDHKLNRMF